MNSAHVSRTDVIVIGAGPAGLAAARALSREGRSVAVMEQEAAVASTWRNHRPGLRLHTLRRHSSLPGTAIPSTYGKYVTSSDLVRYLEDYASEHDLDIRFGVKVDRIEQAGSMMMMAAAATERWAVTTDSGVRHLANTVIVATGYNREEFVPDLPGRADYRRPLLHVSQYAGSRQFRGRDVLVIGSGNAAAEALTELARNGAGRMRMSMRTTPHIVRKVVCGVSAQTIAIVLGRLPLPWADRTGAALARMTIPSLSSHNLPRPTPNLYTRAAQDGSVPVHDAGLVGLVGSGVVEPVAGVVAFKGDAVHLSDGSVIHPEVVIAATGYRRGLGSLVRGMGLLDDRGNPRRQAGDEEPPGLHFIGFTRSASGALRDIVAEVAHVARLERRRCGGTSAHATNSRCAAWNVWRLRSCAGWPLRGTRPSEG